jgi:hypothetical protein
VVTRSAERVDQIWARVELARFAADDTWDRLLSTNATASCLYVRYILVRLQVRGASVSTVLLVALVLAIVLVLLAQWTLCIGGTIDAVSRPREVWHAAGCRKQFWVWQIFGAVFLPVALIYSGLYFGRIRPRLVSAQRDLDAAAYGATGPFGVGAFHSAAMSTVSDQGIVSRQGARPIVGAAGRSRFSPHHRHRGVHFPAWGTV